MYKQNFLCKDCRCQFLAPRQLPAGGRKEAITRAVARELVRGSGIRNIRTIFALVFGTIYKGINALRYDHKPKKEHYGTLEIDEFWTSVGKKGRKVWLIYAYDRRTGDIVVHIWKRRNARTAEKLRRLIRLGVSYDAVATDDRDSFAKVFGSGRHLRGKQYTKGIESNKCRLRHRNRRFFRKICCFSKRLRWHWKVFEAVVFYINFNRFPLPAYIL